MSTGTSLTIITITKDDAVGLARTLASTECWRNEGWVEQVLVDASTVPAVAGYQRVRVVRQSSKGISGAFNEGLAHARGEWVWFLNGGDTIAPALDVGFLRSLLKMSSADAIVGGLIYSGETEPRPHPALLGCWPPYASWMPHPATLVRREVFARAGVFDERYAIAMDFEWWLRALPEGARVDLLSVPFAVFASGGLSQRENEQSRIALERNDAIRRHGFRAWRGWLAATIRMGKASLRAYFSRRRIQ